MDNKPYEAVLSGDAKRAVALAPKPMGKLR
jgi:hypothetical protein